MSFLTVRNDKFFGDDDFDDFTISDEERFCNEILNTSRIMHIYMVLPENKAICIEYLSKRGDWFEIHEVFPNENECIRRFLEIQKLLEEDKA